MHHLTGQTIKGYELHEFIAAGGFGEVYRAFQPLIKRSVALKIILPEYANHPEFILRFEHEAQLIARLEHIHIVPLYDYWRDPDGAFLIMRWLRGGSLRDMVSKGPLDNALTVKIIEQIASALAAAHRQGVVHRDIKPDNILFDEEQNAYLADFGIAKDLRDEIYRDRETGTKSSSDSESSISGSPYYLAPEQIQNMSISSQTDLYSLGVVIYELLTGRSPFAGEGKTLSEILLNHIQDPVPSILEVRPDLPPLVETVIERATAKDPGNRYPDAMSLAVDFRRAMTEGGLAPAPIVSSPADGPTTDEMLIFTTPLEYGTMLIIPIEESNNPYKGLAPFEEADAQDFYGREALIKKLLARMQDTGDNGRCLVVIGPSGSGKSSVVKAGVIPALRQGALPGSAGWYVVDMVPGTNPLRELAAALLGIAIDPPAGLLDQLRQDDQALVEIVNKILPEGDSELLLFIDQFEELFTMSEDETVHAHFLQLLLAAVTAPGSRFRLIITLRADYFDRPLLYPEFGEMVRQRSEIVLPLSADEMRDAIVKPAERVGLAVEPQLVAAIVAEISEQPGALPLLQYALTELYERRAGIRLTLEAYHASGGVLGALARRAEEVHENASADNQQIMRQLFMRLVNLGEGTENSRRRVLRSILLSVADPDTVNDVLDELGRYRLLTFDYQEETRAPMVAVAHEALIREWQRLRIWLDESREDILLQRRLAQATLEWHNQNCDDSFLAAGMRLHQFENLLHANTVVLTPDERNYVEVSVNRRLAQEEAERQRLAHEQVLERRARNRLRTIAIGAVASSIVMALLAVIAYMAFDEAGAAQKVAERNADVAHSQLLAQRALSQSNERTGDLPFDAISEVVESIHLDNPPPFSQRALAEIVFQPGALRHFEGHTGELWSVAVSADGALVASGAGTEDPGPNEIADNSIILWDAATGTIVQQFAGHADRVYALDISDDSARLISVSQDSSIYVWDIASGALELKLGEDGPGHAGKTVWATQFLPGDSSRAITSGSDRTLVLWNLETGEIIHRFTGHRGTVIDFDISADGQRLVSAGREKVVMLWDMTTYEKIDELALENGPYGVAFSPDHSQVIIGGQDKYLTLWEPATRDVTQFGDLPDDARSIDFSPDGKTVLTGHPNGSVMLWDVKSGQLLTHFQGHDDRVNMVEYGPDSAVAYSASYDFTVIQWDLTGKGMINQQFVADSERFYSAALSPDEQSVLAGTKDGRLLLWDVATGTISGEFPTESDAAIHSVAFSPDGTLAVSGAHDGRVMVWDVATLSLHQALAGHPVPVRSVAFSPDGQIIASTGGTVLYGAGRENLNDIVLWNVADGTEIRRLVAHTAPVRNIAFSPDGTQLISGADDGLAIVWDVSTGTPTQRLTGHSAAVLSVAFNADGTQALSGSADETVMLWNPANGTAIKTLRGHHAPVRGVGFGPAGLAVSAAGRLPASEAIIDNSVIIWDLSAGEEIRRLEAHADVVRSLVLSVDRTQALSAADDGRIILWQIDTLDQLVDWLYAHYDVYCYRGDGFPGTDPRCKTPVAKITVETEAETEKLTLVEVTAPAPEICLIEIRANIPQGTIDTAAYRTEPPYTIGFSTATSTTADAYIAAWTEYAASQQADIGDFIVLVSPADEPNQQIEQIRALITDGVDALIVNPNELADQAQLADVLSEASAARIPVILVGHRVKGVPTNHYVSFVGPDDYRIGCVMAQELVRLLDNEGNRSQFNGVNTSLSDDLRKNGARAVFSLYDINLPHEGATGLNPDTTIDILQGAKGTRIDGVFAYNGPLALAGEKHLQEESQRVVPVVADQYAGLAQWMTQYGVPFSLVRIPSTMGANAVAITLAILQGEPVDQFVEIELEVIRSEDLTAEDLAQPKNSMLRDLADLPAEYHPDLE